MNLISKDNIQLVIPMSGMGKRFSTAGYKLPKPLIEVDKKPIIEHVVNLFPGINDITFICNDFHIENTDMVNVLRRIVPNCKIIKIPVQKFGPVNAIAQIFDQIDDSKEIIVSYCDYGTSWDFDKFLTNTRVLNSDGAIACYRGFHPHMLGTDNYAFIKLNDNGFLKQIKEKEPFTNDRMSEYASNGTYYFASGKLLKKYFSKAIDNKLTTNGEFYVSLVYNLLAKDDLKISIFEIEKMLQWGTPHDLEIYKSWSNYFSNIIINQTRAINPPNTTTVLPMAGNGSRFKQQGYELPKPLLNVNNLPMVIQAINCLPHSDNNTFICLKDHIDEYNINNVLKQHYQNSDVISISEVTQGQACTCEIGIKKSNLDLNNPIMISACDNGVYYDSEKYQKLVDDKNVDIIVWSFKNNHASKINPDMYAWLDVDNDDFIKHVSCKKFIYNDPLKTHAIVGTMFFRKASYFIDGLLENINNNVRVNNEFYVDDVINRCIEKGLKVKVFEVTNYICWGTPDDYKTYNYWKEFFNNCVWHPYQLEIDSTNSTCNFDV